MGKYLFVVLILALGIGLFFYVNKSSAPEESISGTKMKIESTAFKNNDLIPEKYTCDGKNINPPLSISNVPTGTKQLILIMHDVDSPSHDFLHWMVWNINPDTKEIPEEVGVKGQVIKNNFDERKYGGPCPGNGTHRYFFDLYAVNTIINFIAEPNREQLDAAMKPNVIEMATLVGKYSRKSK